MPRKLVPLGLFDAIPLRLTTLTSLFRMDQQQFFRLLLLMRSPSLDDIKTILLRVWALSSRLHMEKRKRSASLIRTSVTPMS